MTVDGKAAWWPFRCNPDEFGRGFTDVSPHDPWPSCNHRTYRHRGRGLWRVAFYRKYEARTQRDGARHRRMRASRQNAPRQERDSVDLSDSQLASVKVEPLEERDFPVEKDAIGSIDFNEDMSVQVFTPYQGRIIGLFASIGDDVKKGPNAVHHRQPRSAAGRVDADRGRWRSGIDHPQSDAASRAL